MTGQSKPPIERTASDSVATPDRTDVTLETSAGVASAHRSSGGTPEASASDVSGNSVTIEVTGRPPRQEDGTPDTASRLLTALKARGATWTEAFDLAKAQGRPENGEDAELRHADPKRRLPIQITRAEQTIWNELGRHGVVTRTCTFEEAADLLWKALTHKRIPPDQKGGLVLALDAATPAAFAMRPVIDALLKRHDPSQLGFFAVWVVGPTSDLVVHLAGDRCLG